MSITGITGGPSAVPAPTREQLAAIIAARPAAAQQQAVALAGVSQGTSGQGTPAIDPASPGGSIDLYA